MPATFTLSDLALSPDTIHEGQAVHISYNVHNGGEEAGAHRDHVEIRHVGHGGEILDHFIDNPSLEPDASQPVTCTKSSIQNGDYTVRVTIDVDGASHITETNLTIPRG